MLRMAFMYFLSKAYSTPHTVFGSRSNKDGRSIEFDFMFNFRIGQI